MKLIEEQNYSNNDKNEPRKNHVIKIFSKNENIKIYDLEIFIDDCLKKYNEYLKSKTNTNQYYFCFIDSDNDGCIINYSERIFNSNRTFNTIFFEEKDKFLYNLKFFLNSKDWYSKKGIPYHLGILLHGVPGCGKTSLIKAILTHTKRHAFVIPLNRVKTCGELENIFYETEVNGREILMNDRIYIFEDIDCLTDIVSDRSIEKKENLKIDNEFELIYKLNDISLNKTVNPDDQLNLACLLNIFDGILEIPGRMIILTSNYPERIDSALLRPGRIDLNIELKRASRDIIKEIFQSFYDIDINENEELFKDIIGYKLTHAEIINICQKNINDFKKSIEQILELSK
jgi:SpoVK/Ycf46/Vps4 family AAA+-type ATPase